MWRVILNVDLKSHKHTCSSFSCSSSLEMSACRCRMQEWYRDCPEWYRDCLEWYRGCPEWYRDYSEWYRDC